MAGFYGFSSVIGLLTIAARNDGPTTLIPVVGSFLVAKSAKVQPVFRGALRTSGALQAAGLALVAMGLQVETRYRVLDGWRMSVGPTAGGAHAGLHLRF